MDPFVWMNSSACDAVAAIRCKSTINKMQVTQVFGPACRSISCDASLSGFNLFMYLAIASGNYFLVLIMLFVNMRK